MKKLFCLIVIIAVIFPCVYAKKPDPLYLNSEVIDMDVIEQKKLEKQQKKEAKKKRKKPKKLKRWQIDKAKMPLTTDEYEQMAQETLRTDFEIPEPDFKQRNSEFILPDPMFRVISYNTPPGQRNIDITQLAKNRTASSPAILSPDKTKMVYTKSFFYPQTLQTASAAYLIPLKKTRAFQDAFDLLYKTNIVQGSTEPIFTVGSEYLQRYKFVTLFPLDFSKDSKKLAFKEKIGSNMAGTWVTNIVVYDFNTKTYKRLTAIREAIVYYWRQKNIELKDYRWDIYPIGWDANNPNRIIVYAYGYTSDKPLFLGTWSIDSNENRSELVSLDSTDASIDLNGFGLLELKMQH